MGTPKPKSIHSGLTKNQKRIKQKTDSLFESAGSLLRSTVPTYNEGSRAVSKREPSSIQEGAEKDPIKDGYLSEKDPSGIRETKGSRAVSERELSSIREGAERELSSIREGAEEKIVRNIKQKKINIDPLDPIWTITDKRATILHYLIRNEGKILTRKDIACATGIKVPTIRKAIQCLNKEGFISKPKNFKNRGITFSIHNDICNRFIKHRLPTLKEPSSIQEGAEQYPRGSRAVSKKEPSNYEIEKVKFLFYSSRTTITKELGYWKTKGLSKKQFIQWMKISACNEETLLRYLSYCRFEMVDLGVEESKPVDNVLNWFYKILERNGSYPKPKGYKSFEEKRLEEERESVAERKRIAAEKEELYRAKIKAERDAEFFEMLTDPNHELYKKCFEKLNKFVKGRKGKKSFEMAMRKEFDELMEGGE